MMTRPAFDPTGYESPELAELNRPIDNLSWDVIDAQAILRAMVIDSDRAGYDAQLIVYLAAQSTLKDALAQYDRDLSAYSARVEAAGSLAAYLGTDTSDASTQEELPITELIPGATIIIDEVYAGLVGAMLWSSTDDDDDHLDSKYSEADLIEPSRVKLRSLCTAFVEKAGALLREENFIGTADGSLASRIGHDLWLTIAGHGAGFWDGDWTCGDELTELVETLDFDGDPYVGDDGRLHL